MPGFLVAMLSRLLLGLAKAQDIPVEDNVAPPPPPLVEAPPLEAPLPVVDPTLPQPESPLIEQHSMALAPLPPGTPETVPVPDTSAVDVIPLPGAEETDDDFRPPLVKAPSGFSTPLGAVLPPERKMLTEFQFGVGSSVVYDSNVLQAPDTLAMPAEDDVIWSISPYVAYQKRGAEWSLGARVALNYNTYFENSDFGGLGYSAALNAGYRGGPLSVTASFSSSYDQGVNRFYSNSYVETLNFGAGLGASYQWSPKTSFDLRFGYTWAEPDQSNFGATSSVNLDVAAMWQATPLIRVGPGIAWSLSSGDIQADRQTLGPMIRATYNLSRKIAVDGTLGLDFVDYGGSGGSDTSYSAGLGVRYDYSELWGLSFSYYHGTTADGSQAGGFRESSTFSLDYHRRLPHAALSLGVSYSYDDTSVEGITLAAGTGASDYLSLNASLGMPIFAGRATLSTFASWRQQSGNGARSWDGYQVGVSIGTQF